MRPWRAIVSGLRALLRGRETQQDLDDEVAHWFEAAVAELVGRGEAADEARRLVRLRYGDAFVAREEVRSAGWESLVESTAYDLRLAARNLRRAPAFTAVVVLTLGVAVGGVSAIFGAVGPGLFRPLAYPNADRIVSLSDQGGTSLIPVTFGTVLELADRARTLEALAAYKPWRPTLTGESEPTQLEGQSVGAAYFHVLGVAPAIGQGFDPSGDRPGRPHTVLLSDGLFRERFGADPSIVGRMITLDGTPTTVGGVMPASFEDVAAPLAQVWTLLRYDPAPADFGAREWGHHLGAIGLLRRGATLEDARAELRMIADSPVSEHPRPAWASMAGGLVSAHLRDAVIADVKPTMLILLGAAGLLLLVACANLTLVLLARGARRRGEFAMRVALGAGRIRLARYLLTESLLLAGLGGTLGIVLGRVGLTALTAVTPVSIPRAATTALDPLVLGVSLGLVTLVGVVFGLAPGLHRTDGGPGSDAGGGSRATRRVPAYRHALVVAQVAVATVLLVGSGLLVRSARILLATPFGVDADGVAVLQVSGTGLEPGDVATHRFFDDAQAAVQAVPGVRSAATTSQLPLSGEAELYGVSADDAEGVPTFLGPAYRYAVTPAYFETMGLDLLRGRGLETRDAAGAVAVAVVSMGLARALSPDADVLGRRVRVGDETTTWYTVVGVAEDAKQESLDADAVAAVYVTPQQWRWADRVRWVVVRTDGDPVALLPDVRRAIWSADPNQPIVRAHSMRDMVARSEARRRFVLTVVTAFGLAAMLVAGIGLYGVLAGSVAERRMELGVRAALGASREELVRAVLARGLALAAVGGAAGLIGAVAASRVLSALLFGVSRLDPFTYAATLALLGLAAATACLVPAVRAGRTDPATALRSDG